MHKELRGGWSDPLSLKKNEIGGPPISDPPPPLPPLRGGPSFDTLSWQVLVRQATASRGIGWMYACAALTAIHVAKLLMATAARLSEPQQLDYNRL